MDKKMLTPRNSNRKGTLGLSIEVEIIETPEPHQTVAKP